MLRSLISYLFIIPTLAHAELPFANDNAGATKGCARYLTRDRAVIRLDVRTRADAGRDRTDAGPRHAVASNGVVVRVDREDERVLIVVGAGIDRPARSVATSFAGPAVIEALSPDARFVVLTVDGAGTFLISTETGVTLRCLAVAHEVAAAGESRAYRFGDEGRQLTIAHRGFVRVLRLFTADPRDVIVHLGDTSTSEGRISAMLGAPINGLASATYLPDRHALVALYHGPRPLRIDLHPGGGFAVSEFAPSVGRDDHFDRLRGEQYYAGVVATNQDRLVTASLHGRGSRIELFSTTTLALIKTFNAPAGADLLALSPDGRTVIAAAAYADRLLVFSVNARNKGPVAEIEFPRRGLDRVAFTADGDLALTSDHLGWVKTLTLPRVKKP